MRSRPHRPPQSVVLHPLFTNTSSMDYAERNPKIIIRTGSPALHIPDRDTMAYSEDGGRTWTAFSIGQSGPAAGRRAGGGGRGSVTLNADGSVFMSLAGNP
jgi:xyloglucan-specific exo-beta-1,4-glucanase